MKIISENYPKILKKAYEKYKFIKFEDNFDKSEKVILWRHDIDFSPHRAFSMAKEEYKLGIKAYYFVHVSSIYYNVLEPYISELIRKIYSLGHIIGVHFDASKYNENNFQRIEENIKFEANIIERIIDDDIKVFSVHNPSTLRKVSLDKTSYFGLINASSSKLLKDFKYCSDSNGFWRFESLNNLLLDDNINRLYVLTHPVWWQEEEMSPRDKISRSILGRSTNCLNSYDKLLKANNRQNIR